MKSSILFLPSILVCLIIPSVSYAKKDSDLLRNLRHCSTISSNDARLICFDKLIPRTTKQTITAVTTVATLPQPPKVKGKSAEQKQIDNFAKEHLKKSKEEQGPSSIVSTVIKAKQLLRGQWVIDLENGQKWQQKDTARIKLNVGNKVRLDKGALGAVYLYKEGSSRNIKVKRLK